MVFCVVWALAVPETKYLSHQELLMLEYILEVNMPNANNLLVRRESWG